MHSARSLWFLALPLVAIANSGCSDDGSHDSVDTSMSSAVTASSSAVGSGGAATHGTGAGAGGATTGASGGGAGAGGATTTPPSRFIGYGVVESWRLLDPSELAGLLHAAGLNLTEIEYVGNGPAGDGVWANIDHAKTIAFVEAMRNADVWTFINLVNWNGEDERARSDDEFQAELDFIEQSIGPDRVILQAVSEWDDSRGGKAAVWVDKVATQWPGVKVWNKGARPDDGPQDHLLDWHPCAVGDVPETSAADRFLVNTDCGATIEDLDADRNQIPGYVEQVLGAGFHFHYYEAVGDAPNQIQPDVIQRIAEGKLAAGL